MAEIDLSNMDLADMAERINEAIERHITFVSSKSYVAEDGEGDSIELVQGLTDAPVDVGWATLPVGIYAFVANEDGTLRLGCPIYECLTRADMFEEIVSDGLSEDDTLAEILRLITTEWRPQEFELEGRKVDAGLVFIGLAALDAPDSEAQLIREMLDQSPIHVASNGVPPLTKIRPPIHYWPNAKDSNTLTDPDLFETGGLTLDVGRRKGQVFVYFDLTMDEGYESTGIRIDHTDRQIISAVSTLMEAARRETGEPVVSAYNICEAMGIMHPEPAKQAEIDERMSRLMSTMARIDFSEEARKRKTVNPATGIPFKSAVITRHLVEAQRFEGVDEGGNYYVRYKLLADPPTHEHAKLIGQEVTWPQRMQELPALKPDGTAYRRSSGRQIAIKHEILARTYSLMNRKSNQSGTILYDTLCRTVGVDPKNRSAKKTVVDFAEGFLRALKAEGVIKGFQPFREGSSQKKAGVKLFVQQR